MFLGLLLSLFRILGVHVDDSISLDAREELSGDIFQPGQILASPLPSNAMGGSEAAEESLC